MPRSVRAALLALALLTSGCLPARSRPALVAPVPGLQVSIDEAFYGIEGVTAPELNRQLAQRGPLHEGMRWHGLTNFRLVYTYLPFAEANGCRAADPRVSVSVVTTLPEWKDRGAAPEPLRADWDLFLGRLREHEEGHRRIAIVAGEQLLEQVAALRAPDCESLREGARAVADARRASLAREQEGWDLETEHGLGEG